MKENSPVEQKVIRAVDRYLDRLLEPQVLEEANLAQVTKTLEMLLTRFSDGVPVPESPEDPLSAGLRKLAEEMEKDVMTQDDLPQTAADPGIPLYPLSDPDL